MKNAICVFCGSSPGTEESYSQAAEELAKALAKNGLSLVYGGGSLGLMGKMADVVLGNGGTVVGVIPEFMSQKEVMHRGLSEIHIVSSMHERKALMGNLADAFICLPGGVGTLEEMFEVISWLQLGIHNKPVSILNIDSYYDKLLDFLQYSVEKGFIRQENFERIIIDTDPERLLYSIYDSSKNRIFSFDDSFT
ncbi:MAG: TIGR00730 family Rossman fold protein [Leptospiraceae bacterium]|nr:TIGR00730 family Rossman fold protein [Leptospiraceae bacterium]MCP5502925.1 TIGR00730 family Rossman fold protein [Leptospiraceae bacterium]